MSSFKFSANTPEFVPGGGAIGTSTTPFHNWGSQPEPTISSDVDELAENDLDAAADAYLEFEADNGYDTMQPEEVLRSIFSDVPIDRIANVLSTSNYNILDAMDVLFGKTEVQDVKSEVKGQVCRHFLAGSCHRSDCWYLHDPEALLCKFWLRGHCVKEDQCEFTHGNVLAQTVGSLSSPEPFTSRKAEQVKDTIIPERDSFPALSNAKVTKKFDFWGPTKDFAKVAKQKAVTDKSVMNKYQEERRLKVAMEKRPVKIRQVQWVSTGDNVAAAYANHRQHAIEAAIQRNQLFQRATEAYLAGNKAAAKAFSLQAHALNDEVTELHREAGARIFAERNQVFSTRGTNNGQESSVDLHGLHPNEAVDMLETTLRQLRQERFNGQLVVVTGTGHHSQGQRARIYPAVKNFLREKNFSFKEGSMVDGRGGMFSIRM
ncbi:hypothetical protein DFS34DRAFT_576563 [Phlyctochytrium arcticum]|nr:hypothetical protein DFS34DRAFT_576563 [Phlyctochytrium arcticum]